ncbi:N-acetylglucosamine kinase [Algibacillus agarilyticus]|uniref:N-acetylglucosamine kinase n=1 Tax=Algibacillus agarilyticus TaxID=2234133 RepID=UPI000DCFA4ED|nr:BadF/BadG/BcrA/BcrD ATPase family protein [Algibacillus agarilyticus]
MTDYPLILGIDGGGTKCKAVLFCAEQQKIIATGIAGPANPVHGIEAAQAAIISAAQSALHQANLPRSQLANLVVGAGLAGVNLPKYFAIMQDWAHPFQDFHLTTDLHTACYGAHNALHGSAIIIGTGSCGVSLIDDQTLMFGGHGFGLGDKGSGAWIGLTAVQHVLEAFDGIAAPTQLSELILNKLNVSDPYAIIERLTKAPPAAYGQLAPLVFQAATLDDAVAQSILRDGGHYISALARKLLATNPPRLSILGGLAHLMQDWLDQDIREKTLPALGQPTDGCILFAQHKLKQR